MPAKSGWFWPVAKDYRKQKQQFVLVNRAAGRRSGDVTINFAPVIRLTTDRTDFRSDFMRIFQTNAVRREVSSSRQTKVNQLLSSLFSTFGRTVREITRSSTRERISPAKAQGRKENPEVFLGAFATLREKSSIAITSALDHFAHVSELRLFTTATHSQQRHDRWLLLRSRDTEREVESPSTTNVFTTLSLNFASGKVSETELVQQQIARFVSSPELTHVKRQQGMSEGIVQALRALKTPEPEPKRVAAPALPSIEQITNQVKTQLERELRIERERRGL